MAKKVELTTFGMKKGNAPDLGTFDVTVDCRAIQNPHNIHDHSSEDVVLGNQAYPAVLCVGLMNTLQRLRTADAVRVGVYCAYGVHRSRVVATQMAAALIGWGAAVTEKHL
jgi:RNase adaptor protein for sRNA GlmZ degradation